MQFYKKFKNLVKQSLKKLRLDNVFHKFVLKSNQVCGFMSI